MTKVKTWYYIVYPEQPEIIYKIIKESDSGFPVEKMCETLEVSRSGFYDWDSREPSKRQKENKEIQDLFHKEIVGWALADHMRTELCLEALRNALKRHRPAKGLIHHSDGGAQYCSAAYIRELEQNEIIRSMSSKGNCFDNASAETFFSTIKSERPNHIQYKNFTEARNDIFWYIDNLFEPNYWIYNTYPNCNPY